MSLIKGIFSHDVEKPDDDQQEKLLYSLFTASLSNTLMVSLNERSNL